MKVYTEHDLPVPTIRLQLVGDLPPHPSVVLLILELGTCFGEPLLALTLEWTWRRPRPWEFDVGLPWRRTAPAPELQERRLVWRRPGPPVRGAE